MDELLAILLRVQDALTKGNTELAKNEIDDAICFVEGSMDNADRMIATINAANRKGG
jgi:hypothetical protein